MVGYEINQRKCTHPDIWLMFGLKCQTTKRIDLQQTLRRWKRFVFNPSPKHYLIISIGFKIMIIEAGPLLICSTVSYPHHTVYVLMYWHSFFYDNELKTYIWIPTRECYFSPFSFTNRKYFINKKQKLFVTLFQHVYR